MFVSAFSFASVVCFGIAFTAADPVIAGGFCFVGVVYQAICITLVVVDVVDLLKASK